MVFIIIFLMSALVAWKMTDIGAGLIALIAAICALLFAGNYEESYENIYESQVTIVERYLISEKTDEDWQKTKELLQTTNEKAKQIEKKKEKYFFTDFVYVCCPNSVSADDYRVAILDDKIVFPEHYEMSNVVKGTSQETTEPTTEATYKETEINGTKYKLVPLA